MIDYRFQTEYNIDFKTDKSLNCDVTVIITLYNYSKYIIETLERVKKQTLDNFDLVIVDDFSSDNSKEIVIDWLKINNNRFNKALLISHIKNYGLRYSRNTAFENSDTKYIFSLDADNHIYPKCLKQLSDALDNSDAGFAYSILEKFGETTDLMNLNKWNIEAFQFQNEIDNMSLIRKSIWEKVGGYTTDMPPYGWEDYDFWFKIAKIGSWGLQVPQILGRYRVHKNSMLSETKKHHLVLFQYFLERYPEFFSPSRRNELLNLIYKKNTNIVNQEKLIIQLKELTQSRSWKLLVLTKRIYYELYKSFNPDFFKWLFYRIFTKRMPSNLDLSKYEPIDLHLLNNEVKNVNSEITYDEWLNNYHFLDDKKRNQLKYIIQNMTFQPKISVIMPTYNSNLKWLEEAVNSVRNQIYKNWELCIADDASKNTEVIKYLKKLSQEDDRIKIVYREINGHISAASNSAAEIATGDWIAILDHDDVISEDALFWVAYNINENPNCKLIFSDNDKIDTDGNLIFPFFKPDWNYRMMLSVNIINHLAVYNSDIFRKIGGFRKGYEGSQDYDLSLRFIEKIDKSQIIHIPRILYHWRMHENSLSMNIGAKEYAYSSSKKALQDHFQRQDIDAEVFENKNKTKRIKYKIPNNSPLVSIIIPTKNNYKLIKNCIKKILKKTKYQNYEILVVNNNSTDIKTLNYLDKIDKQRNIKVIEDNGPFNFSKINNDAVKQTKGELICFLNDDTEVISSDWLTEMVSNIIQKGVGIVGAKLLYPNNTIQHSGVIIGLNNHVAHIFRNEYKNNQGYFNRAIISQNLLAVTGACLMIKRNIFEAVDGFNETDLKVAFNDIDLCLKVYEIGYEIIFNPEVLLYHYESVSRGFDDTPDKLARFNKETDYFEKKWKKYIKNDPSYNPNLSLNSINFELALKPRIESIEDIYNKFVKLNEVEE